MQLRKVEEAVVDQPFLRVLHSRWHTMDRGHTGQPTGAFDLGFNADVH